MLRSVVFSLKSFLEAGSAETLVATQLVQTAEHEPTVTARVVSVDVCLVRGRVLQELV